jgi:hypothetical protein
MMAATKIDIQNWLNTGKIQGSTHLLVICDEFSHNDYPVYINSGESVRNKFDEYDQGKHSMQRVIEVYNLSLPFEDQLKEFRAFHF